MKKALAFIMILLLLSSGCGRPKEENARTPAADAVTAAPTDRPAESGATPESEPTADPQQDAATPEPIQYAFTFTAKTLEGETVTEAFFGQYDLTMVNIWASWCGPCRGELEELGKLYDRLPENVGFLSVTVDDSRDLKDAAALLKENGCTFPCVDGQGSEGLMNSFVGRTMYIPSTLFLDRNGNEVGQWIVGVPQGGGSVADAYMGEIQARLDQLSGK